MRNVVEQILREDLHRLHRQERQPGLCRIGSEMPKFLLQLTEAMSMENTLPKFELAAILMYLSVLPEAQLRGTNTDNPNRVCAGLL